MLRERLGAAGDAGRYAASYVENRMNNKVSRPPTVWLTQTLLVLFSLLMLGVTVLNLVMLAARARGGAPVLALLVGFIIPLGFMLLLLVAFWGLAKRKKYGKWLALLSLVLLWAVIILGQLLRPTGPLRYYEYTSTAELVGAAIFYVFIHGLFLALIMRL